MNIKNKSFYICLSHSYLSALQGAAPIGAKEILKEQKQ